MQQSLHQEICAVFGRAIGVFDASPNGGTYMYYVYILLKSTHSYFQGNPMRDVEKSHGETIRRNCN